jgi:hypothetical protein
VSPSSGAAQAADCPDVAAVWPRPPFIGRGGARGASRPHTYCPHTYLEARFPFLAVLTRRYLDIPIARRPSLMWSSTTRRRVDLVG